MCGDRVLKMPDSHHIVGLFITHISISHRLHLWHILAISPTEKSCVIETTPTPNHLSGRVLWGCREQDARTRRLI